MSHRKTHEEYVKQLEKVNPYIKTLSFYVNALEKIKVTDIRCGHVWSTIPNNLIYGCGCPICSIKKGAEKQATPLDLMLLRLEERWGNLIQYISGYTNQKNKCRWWCSVCGNMWEATPNNVLRGSGCPECAKKKRADSRKILIDEFLRRLREVWGDLIEYVDGYVNLRKKCRFRCTNCGHVWNAEPHNILHGNGCPLCRINELTMPLDEMLQRVYLIWGDSVIYVKGYVNTKTKCVWRCKDCGHEWITAPSNIIYNKTGCPICAIKRRALSNTTTLDEMLQRLKEVWGDEIIYVSGYVNIMTKCKWKCKTCGNEWETAPNDILHGTGCPLCAIYSLERPVMKMLKEKGIIPIHNKALEGSNYKGSSKPLRVDFIIETDKGKLAIETDGEQHFIPVHGEDELKFQQEKDRHKDKILKERGYITIRATSTYTKKFAMKNHITISDLFNLLQIGVNKETGEIDFELFRKYDFNRE